jgi:hypothetical protein
MPGIRMQRQVAKFAEHVLDADRLQWAEMALLELGQEPVMVELGPRLRQRIQKTCKALLKEALHIKPLRTAITSNMGAVIVIRNELSTGVVPWQHGRDTITYSGTFTINSNGNAYMRGMDKI